MGSGKYSALSGAVAREQAMGNIAANLTNVNTTGFKKDRISFAAILRGAKQTADARGINFTRIREIGTDFSQGGMQTTGRSLDLAIDGEGFFKVQGNNEVYYTRSGHLMLDENGLLKTSEGFTVLGEGNQPLQLDPAIGANIHINEWGAIAVNGIPADGRLQLFAVNEPQNLIKSGTSLYRLEEGGGDQPMEIFRVIQGKLETSNVNMMEEMVTMVAAQRAFEAHLKALEAYSKLSEKQDELGTVS
ncbi:flagellar basal-body rod protein FlgF [Desulfobulbus alkaliphilus]|uniref:flagellar basal-body rod protein FlgF n=1 Tax=Desulfobulbus alkaliphilus TaxID=869814 RepID=UPI0019661393|nr:flagellar basal-body rod protein FlgF [Desulfobulbus alkaliphilus]MBM9537412.1 flagellar basal-body rod protein FlgF [Desulfobulbus alkaliphilus]